MQIIPEGYKSLSTLPASVRFKIYLSVPLRLRISNYIKDFYAC